MNFYREFHTYHEYCKKSKLSPVGTFQMRGKINFLGIFGVKKQWIIGQQSQNSARYAVAF